MKLTLNRWELEPGYTLGSLYVGSAPVFECYTLEDTVRAPGVKVPGKTAIPFGTYEVKITHSPRFGVDMPIVLDVPGFEGIRIHPGNRPEDTEGCLLVGMGCDTTKGTISDSRKAYEALFAKLAAAQARGEKITLTITR